jgi:hypothetical protein
MAYINDKQILKAVVHMQQGYEDGYEDGYEAGQKSVIDESKIIEATAEGRNSVTINDVSEIKHKIKVTLDPYIEPGTDICTLTVTRNGEEVETYEMWPFGTIEIDSSSPNITFAVEDVHVEITVNYQKSWGIQQGREQEYDKFWDVFQDPTNKKGQNYYYAFSANRFNEETYNPKYPIKCSDGTTTSRYVFYNTTLITDTKVEIITNSNNAEYIFCGAENLVNIRKLTVYESTTFSNAFTSCSALVEIRFGGTIGQSINFKYSSKLSDESIDSIIEHLKDLTGATAKTLTVHTTVYNKIVSSGKDALITAKNWTLVKA